MASGYLRKAIKMGLVGPCSSIVSRKELLYFGKNFDCRARYRHAETGCYEHRNSETCVNGKVM